jgi:clusterin-associated protein 1
LGSQITLKGAALYDLLGKEVELREKRNNVLARQLEITEVEQALRSSVKTVEDEIKVKIHLFLNIRETFKNEEA